MEDFDYYVEKVTQMLELASTAHDAAAKAEFERLADEYRSLSKNARNTPQPKRA